MRPTSPIARKIRKRLDARRRALLVRYKNTLERADDELSAHDVELVDVANDRWDASVLATMSECDRRALDHIVDALRRLERGDYGTCTACGDRIPRARLAILPEAATCAACASEAERAA